MPISEQLYDEYLWCKDMHFSGAITCALMQKRYEDAKILKPGYDTTEALNDDVRPPLELSASVVSYPG